jgi:hypothetical protein
MRIPRTDIRQLSSEVCSGPYKAALPRQLPDHWVHPLARDFRKLEASMRSESRRGPQIEGPVMVSLHIIAGRLQERGFDPSQSLTTEQLLRWLQLYQFVIERELVTRAIGVPPANDDGQTLLSVLDEEIDTLAKGGQLRRLQ